MRHALREWQSVSANDPPQSLRRRTLGATLAVFLVLAATAACVLLADRPKTFSLEQKLSSDEVKYIGSLTAKIDPYSNKILFRDLNTIFSEKNKLASDNAAVAALDGNPEYEASKRKAEQLVEIAKQKEAAAKSVSSLKLRSIMRKYHAATDSISAAIQAEKASEAKFIRFARSNGHAISSSTPHLGSGLLKLFAGVAALDTTSPATSDASTASVLSAAQAVGVSHKLSSNVASVQPVAQAAAAPAAAAAAPAAAAAAAPAPVVDDEDESTFGGSSLSDASSSVALATSSQHLAQQRKSPVTLSPPAYMDAPAAAAAAEAEVEDAQEALDSLAGIENN
jgi:hypothetical protein